MTNRLQVRIESHWYLVEVGDLEGDDIEVIVDGQRFKVNLDKDVINEINTVQKKYPNPCP